MDPNAVLEALLQAMSDYEDTRGGLEDRHTPSADRMRDGIYALDEWLSKGGFLPERWQAGR
jgi:hypothetical protein